MAGIERETFEVIKGKVLMSRERSTSLKNSKKLLLLNGVNFEVIQRDLEETKMFKGLTAEGEGIISEI